MLGDCDVVATAAVKDMAESKKFYGETLGLKQVDENEGGVTYKSGSGRLFIYQAPTAGTGQATCATWSVKELEPVVADLKGKGVSFEHYDMPGMKLNGDIHEMGGGKAAWLKDPSGNVLALISM